MRLWRKGEVAEEWDLACDNDHLYAYEADAVAQYFEAKECPHMTIADTIGNMRTLDACAEVQGSSLAAISYSRKCRSAQSSTFLSASFLAQPYFSWTLPTI